MAQIDHALAFLAVSSGLSDETFARISARTKEMSVAMELAASQGGPNNG